MSDDRLRALPAVHRVVDAEGLAVARDRHGRDAVVRATRDVLAEMRGRLDGSQPQDPPPDLSASAVARLVVERLDRPDRRLRRVVNATGILLHTGLGRAPLAREAIEAVVEAASGYCNLEIDLDTGQRGRRTTSVAALLRELTGAEAATVVNNNAGATVIALRALAAGREVVVARGQLIEIGGSFRLPEIFEVSGARLREVGTTNRTRLSDYESAIGPDTAALLRVHPSNYRVVGFTEDVSIGPLVGLARARGVAAIDDIGSGALAPGRPPIPGDDEPTFAEGLKAGADLVLGSGDKLLGGPQCGLLLGTRAAIARVEADPLMRALRVDKMTLAALEATLRLVLDHGLSPDPIPLWSFLTTPIRALVGRAERLVDLLKQQGKLKAEIARTRAALGGGSVPGEELASIGVRVGPPWPVGIGSEHEFARRLRLGDPAVVGRVQEGSLLFDLRAITPDDDDRLFKAIVIAVGGVVEGEASR